MSNCGGKRKMGKGGKTKNGYAGGGMMQVKKLYNAGGLASAYKNAKTIMDHPLTGIVSTALKPTPLGVAYTGANLLSKATTGKPLAQNVIAAATTKKGDRKEYVGDYGSVRAYGVGTEQGRRAEAKGQKRSVSMKNGGKTKTRGCGAATKGRGHSKKMG